MKTLFFDLDGTLLDTLGDIKCAMNYALMTYHMKEATTDDVRRYVGSGLRNAINAAISEKAGRAVGAREADDIYELMVKYYAANPAVHTRPYDGIPELLLDLQAAGVKMAVLTNKDHSITEPLVKVYFPSVRFLFVHGKKPNTPLKPSSGLTLSLMEEYGIKRRDLIMIGDSDVDYMTAGNVKAESIIVDWGFRTKRELERKGIKETVSSASELRSVLARRVFR